jgi:hypothetical protein
MIENLQLLLNDVSKLPAEQQSTYQWWLVIGLIRDLAYYVLVAIVVIALGRRLIHAILTAYRESKRVA